MVDRKRSWARRVRLLGVGPDDLEVGAGSQAEERVVRPPTRVRPPGFDGRPQELRKSVDRVVQIGRSVDEMVQAGLRHRESTACCAGAILKSLSLSGDGCGQPPLENRLSFGEFQARFGTSAERQVR